MNDPRSHPHNPDGSDFHLIMKSEYVKVDIRTYGQHVLK